MKMTYIPSLSLPAPSLFGLSPRQQCEALKRAGFQGIELFLFPGILKRIPEYQRLTEECGLRLSFHQPWSEKEGGGFFVNKILGAIGFLPKNDYSFEDLIARGRSELFIAYADRFNEVVKLDRETDDLKVSWAFQTACAWQNEGKKFTHSMSYEKFSEQVLRTRFPIVFDTFHMLEWRLDAPGGKALGQYDEDHLAEEMLRAWHDCKPERIVEIHWNDFTGKAAGDGRDCLPGKGKLTKGLNLLAKEILRSGWNGTIVPEISPFLLFPYRERTLIALRERMEAFFQ